MEDAAQNRVQVARVPQVEEAGEVVLERAGVVRVGQARIQLWLLLLRGRRGERLPLLRADLDAPQVRGTPRRIEPFLRRQERWKEQRLNRLELCCRCCVGVAPVADDRGVDALEGPPPTAVNLLDCSKGTVPESLVARAAAAHDATQETQVVDAERVRDVPGQSLLVIGSDTVQPEIQPFVCLVRGPNSVAAVRAELLQIHCQLLDVRSDARGAQECADLVCHPNVAGRRLRSNGRRGCFLIPNRTAEFRLPRGHR